MNGHISDYKRMSVHDGPGIRTTLFLKGCPLRCLWCHNPENLQTKPSLSFTQKLCIGCGACVEVCPNHVHRIDGGQHEIRYDACVNCGLCIQECLTGALKRYGEECTPKEAAARLLEDRIFYEQSGGGVTFSGGEPLLQSTFLAETMALLKAYHVHIAVDTCGDVPWEAFEEVLPYTDLFLYDVKHIDPALHKKGTGSSNERILANLRHLQTCKSDVEIRTPVIPGYNDDEKTLHGIAALLRDCSRVKTWRLLPYHSMAKAKYEAIGMTYTMPETEMPDMARMRALQKELCAIFPGTKLSSD